jgi:sulfur carrier protein
LSELAITVNGKPMDLPDGTTVADLLDRLSIGRQGTAVERNREIVPRSLHTEARIEAGDRIEIVTAVGGG